MTIAIAPIVGFTVVGIPRPKGSLRHIGGGRLIEQNDVTTGLWRSLVVAAAIKAIVTADISPAKPFTGPVEVHIDFRFTRPKKTKFAHAPIGRNVGDTDKLARLIFDALVDAHVIADDSQVIDLHARKRYTRDGEAPGAGISVTAVIDTELENAA